MLRQRKIGFTIVRRPFSVYNAIKDSHSFSDTLNLPKTSFPNRSSPHLIHKTILPQTTVELYKWNETRQDSKELFILHDGPPYANGDLHLGHALNKILKDIINRYELINGKKVFYKPGWDCHGLPIELKALENLNKQRAKEEKLLKKRAKSGEDVSEKLDHLRNSKLSPLEIRELASKHADATIELQKKGFMSLGILGDWSNPYITKDNDYVIDQLKVFKKMFDNGLVHRQDKPVYWGCENRTALAEGELEYNDQHKSTAIYVKFPIVLKTPVLENYKDISALIWTSTPWTIPSNKAICVNGNFNYSVIKTNMGLLIVAKDLVPQLMKLDPTIEILQVVNGSQLIGCQYINPLLQDDEQQFPILHGAHVTNTAGTGLVHTAPGHGQDDYFVCLQNGIKPYSPVDEFGKYTKDLPQVLHESLLGKNVLKHGNPIMISKLSELSMLFHQNEITHSYPYDWRSKKPIIIRSTPQWFVNVDKIKQKTIAALDKVSFYPERGSNRLVSFIKTRNEWCISRQRYWGVPIPVLYNKTTGEPLLTDESIDKIIKVISAEGANSWFKQDSNVEKWLPDSMITARDEYVKGTDTMDVWFDSGTSWNVVEKFLSDVQSNGDDVTKREYLADVYLEGSDQHRGWFQSSILTKIGSSSLKDETVLPYKTIITHGFTLDEKGAKMSKSLGNTILPNAVINGDRNLPAIGIDGLRLWVGQSDYSTDMTMGPTILSRVGDNLKKIRFTLKFLLGNLQNEFEPITVDELQPLDRYVLSKLTKTQYEIKKAYGSFNYAKIVRELNQNMNVLLSSVYFDISKDSLYTDKLTSHKRLSIQTVLLEIYQSYISILSPILPIITQEAWNHTPDYIKRDYATPFHKGWYNLPDHYIDEGLELEFDEFLWKLKDEFKVLLDKGNRVDKLIKNSLELSCNVNIDPNCELSKILLKHKDFLSDYFLTSQFKINSKISNVVYSTIFQSQNQKVELQIAKSEFHKCPRCWKYDSIKEDELCNRCIQVL